ncbi:nucleotidyltransferase domain-containing protein [Halostagnicola kamekurae]|uniref:Predicted nucleotidyltransferase n=1 Tax=Halostagnicola kamekurae TaxID=619731 RepID=A0A1I6RQ74_9EURY|nr:nucleotidyltransferase domain-containing protein [Halostagnicola kamekurae]SFS66893.1 Predicted nucleotidyltransferase [Halostagnicola kamekurae]
MSSESSVEPGTDHGSSVELALPIRDGNLFKHTASSYILNFLSDNPDIHLSVRQLATVTPRTERAVLEAVNTLEANNLIRTFSEGNSRRVQINRDRLNRADDPILSIPQPEFQTPARIALQYLKQELEDIRGVVLFGSTARGEGDRTSDLDLWVLVGGDHMNQRHRANKLGKHLGELRIPSSIGVSNAENADVAANWEAIKERLESDDVPPSAERYSFEIIVETPQSILNQSERVDVEKLFGEGITLETSETLEQVKLEVLSDE